MKITPIEKACCVVLVLAILAFVGSVHHFCNDLKKVGGVEQIVVDTGKGIKRIAHRIQTEE